MSRRLGRGRFSDDELERLLRPLAAVRAVGLAVSGGPDSLGLMLLAGRWARLAARDLPIVYTLDHGLRPEAAAEVAMVVREATRLGMQVRALKWDGEKPATGMQAAARAARYRLIGAQMRHDGIDALVTAHHLEDQAETVLMRLGHGSGVAGLAGMASEAEVEGVHVLRPLLDVPRARLAAEVAAAGLIAADDVSNTDPFYERVRWRQALPALAGLGLTPERLATLAVRMGEADAAIEAAAQDAATAGLGTDAKGRATLPRAMFGDLPAAVAVRLVSVVIERVSGTAPELAQAEDLTRALRDAEPFRGRTLSGCMIRRGSVDISIAREPLSGERARRAGQLTAPPAQAGQQAFAGRQIAEIDPLTGGEPPLYRPHAGPTFAQTPRQPQTAGTPGQD